MWLVVLFLIALIILGCTSRETFVNVNDNKCGANPYNVYDESEKPIKLTADEMNKYYFGYSKPVYEVPIKPVAHPLHYFYEPKYAPYTYGGYYQGMEVPKFWPEDTEGGFVAKS